MGTMIDRGQPCIVDGCGSSDAAAIYEDDGKRYQICFSKTCPSVRKAVWLTGQEDVPAKVKKASKPVSDDWQGLLAEYGSADATGWTDRALPVAAMSHYGVKIVDGTVVFPYFDEDQSLTCLKYRPKNKKDFWTKGESKSQSKLLFGRESFNPGGKMVTITEGEIDALSVYEMFGRKFAAVSVPNGASGALGACKENYQWLNSFETIIIAFDADIPGREAANEVAGLFSGKSKIVKLDSTLKDANGYLMAGKGEQFKQDWWNAREYVPDGIVPGNTLWDRMNVPQAKPVCPWPLVTMNEKLYGIYPRRIYTITAGSGVGKSQFVRELTHWIFLKSSEKIGILMLEEAVEESVLGLMSIHISKPLHVPNTVYTPDEYKKAYDETAGTDRFYFHDHFGSTSIGNILDRVRYMAKVLGCKFIVLDHLSIIVSAQQEGDERKAIDEIMTKLRMLVQETGITLFLISHLKRTQGKEYTEGAQIGVSDLRGSASIEQLSDCIIGLERNGQSTNNRIANTTNIRILKSRQFGRLGLTDGMFYDTMTGRMTQTKTVDTTPEGEVL